MTHIKNNKESSKKIAGSKATIVNNKVNRG